MRARIEFKPRDFFIGIYGERRLADGRIHLWICLVPMLPIHLVFGKDTRLLRSAPRPKGRPLGWRGKRWLVH